jgi:TIR domain
MAYLKEYDHDIFVSYASVDDERYPGSSQGWVARFRDAITVQLAKKLGRREYYELWMDHKLRCGQPLTFEILEKVRGSATLLVVLSKGYLESPWCRRELETFAEFIEHGQGRSIFVAELAPFNDADLPRPLRDRKRSRFYTLDEKTRTPRILGELDITQEYCNTVDDFVREIADDLQRRRGTKPPATLAASAVTDGAIFLAEVTDDLDEQRNGVKRYLEQAGIAVGPNHFPFDPEAFRRTVREGLAEADLFVQLLSDIPGKRPPDLPEGRAKCQLELALSLGKPVLQWRSPTVDLAAVQDNAQHALLDAPTVLAEGIEDFKRTIRRRLLEGRRTEPLRPVSADTSVFIDRDKPDKILAEKLCEILSQYDVWIMQPSDDEDPKR